MDLKKYRAVQTQKLPPVFKFLVKPFELLLLPLVVRLPLHPHLWTALSGLASGIAIFWIVSGLPWIWNLLGLYLALLFDGFDGAVARWQNSCSLAGACADTLTDIISASLVISAVGYHALVHSPETVSARLIAVVILLEILYQTTLVCQSLSGGLLRKQTELPGWHVWLENHNILPFHLVDSVFFIFAVGPLLLSLKSVFILLLCWQVISLFYLLYIQLMAAQKHPKSSSLIRGLMKKLVIRSAGFLLLLAFQLPLFLHPHHQLELVWLITVWIEYWIFYFLTINLLKQGKLIPQQQPAKSRFISRLQTKDLQFFKRWYP